MITNKRNTKQKKLILSYLKNVDTHPTAEQVYFQVKKNLPNVSLGTIYRNLNNMSDDGVLLKLSIDDEYHFDYKTCNHSHFHCKKCKSIIDLEFDYKDRTKDLENIGLKVDCSTLIYSGVCNKCLVGEEK